MVEDTEIYQGAGYKYLAEARFEALFSVVKRAFLKQIIVIESCTVEPRFNDIPGITLNIRFPGKSYSKMYGAEPQFNDIRFNDIPGLKMGILFPERKIFPGITIKSI